MSKLKSENIIEESDIDFSILRTILVYGKVKNLGRNNIVLFVKEMLQKSKEITMVDDQYRMPTYVEDLAFICKICLDKKVKEIFNISSSKLLSVYEIALEVADVFDLDKSLIKRISTNTLNQRAPRPLKTGFDLTKTNKILKFYPKTFSKFYKGLKVYLHKIHLTHKSCSCLKFL